MHVQVNLQIKVFPPVHRALHRPWLRLVRVSEDRSTVLSSPGDVWLRHLIVHTPLLSVLSKSWDVLLFWWETGRLQTPWLLQMRLALCFSLTDTVLGLLSSSMMVGGTTTSKCPVIEIMGSVFTYNKEFRETPLLSRGNLAHVVAAVLGGHVSDLQRPRVVAVVLDVEPEGKRFDISPK